VGSRLTRHQRRRGYTLIEMVVVMAIIAVGMVLSLPMIESGFNAREVRRAARQIAATMHFCRGEAVALGKPQQLVLDPLKNGIFTTDWGRWAILTDRAVIERVNGGITGADGVVQILFFPNGSTSGAEVILANRQDRSRNRLAVKLDPLVGTVRVEDAS
jgi:prepilin-type N-terminal cleavage/methylation domain-containing protein